MDGVGAEEEGAGGSESFFTEVGGGTAAGVLDVCGLRLNANLDLVVVDTLSSSIDFSKDFSC